MRVTLPLLAALGVAAPLAAQGPSPSTPPAITLGTARTLHSSILGEDRPYFVYLPEGPRRGPFALIVLLDGDAQFHHTTGIVRFLTDQGRMPQALVVAVPNTTDRTRDLTPPAQDSAALRTTFPTAGGADRMLGFLADELLPEVERTYGASPFRVLIGHSFGGLFAAHALVARPMLFQGYIAISPSLWWDGGRYADSLARRGGDGSNPSPWFYATMGGQEPEVQLVPFGQVARATNRPDWRLLMLPEDDHGSTPHRSTYDGLETIFRPLRLPVDSLVALGIAGLDRRYTDLSARYGLFNGTPEPALNALGYRLLAEGPGHAADGVAAFRENARRFPRSANTYDSLADGFLALGQRETALACFANAVRTGRAYPNEGGTIAGSVIAPLSLGRMVTLARELGRPVWSAEAIPASVERDCLNGKSG
ncbi:MAG: alpha/beta hydrolase [Gemmatimonadales bacterium]